MTRLMFNILGPVLLWSVHFIAIYALISAACAPRGLLEIDVMRAVAGLGTLVLGLPMIYWMVRGLRETRRADNASDQHPLAIAAFWTAAISLAAILANLWPIAMLTTCIG